MSVDRQQELMDELQEMLLEDFVRLYREGKLSPTDRRTIVQLLKDSGRTFDPSRLPRTLADAIKEKYKLPEQQAPEDEDPI